MDGMEWLDQAFERLEKLKRAEAAKARNVALVSQRAEEVFAQLWGRVMAALKLAERKGIETFANGTPHEREIRRPGRSGREATEIVIALAGDRQSIVVSGHVTLVLQLDVCDGGVVCMKLNGLPISIEESVREILYPFLFAELLGTADE